MYLSKNISFTRENNTRHRTRSRSAVDNTENKTVSKSSDDSGAIDTDDEDFTVKKYVSWSIRWVWCMFTDFSPIYSFYQRNATEHASRKLKISAT